MNPPSALFFYFRFALFNLCLCVRGRWVGGVSSLSETARAGKKERGRGEDAKHSCHKKRTTYPRRRRMGHRKTTTRELAACWCAALACFLTGPCSLARMLMELDTPARCLPAATTQSESPTAHTHTRRSVKAVTPHPQRGEKTKTCSGKDEGSHAGRAGVVHKQRMAKEQHTKNKTSERYKGHSLPRRQARMRRMNSQ